VLTISSAIVGHKWLKRNEKQECPLHVYNKDIVRILLDPVNKSHIVLAVNSSGQKKITENTSHASNEVYKCHTFFFCFFLRAFV